MDKSTLPSEQALVTLSQGGDFAAFEELVNRTEARLYSLLLRMTGNPDDAKDLLQEAFLSAYKNISGFKGNSTFSTWIYRIATNHALMHLRKKKPDVPLDDLPIPTHEELKKSHITDWDIDPATAAYRSEVRQILDQAIEKLPPPYRAVVALRDVEGMSTIETATILDINEGAVKTRLHRARIFLRQLLNEHFEVSELIEAVEKDK